MNRYFYSVESDNGVMFLHLFGNVYKNDSGDEKDYSCAEWTHFYVKVEEAKKMLAAGKFFDYADEWVCYLDNISEESAQNICYRYFGDYSGIELSIADISENTPVGDYWFDYKESEGLVPHLFFSSKTAQDIRYGYSDKYPLYIFSLYLPSRTCLAVFSSNK